MGVALSLLEMSSLILASAVLEDCQMSCWVADRLTLQTASSKNEANIKCPSPMSPQGFYKWHNINLNITLEKHQINFLFRNGTPEKEACPWLQLKPLLADLKPISICHLLRQLILDPGIEGNTEMSWWKMNHIQY